jgi:hypothetical protein
MKPTFILVDFENVQPKNMGLLQGGIYKIRVFVGAKQNKISLDTARALQTFGPDAEYVQIESSGKNALDFHIAYYLGRLTAKNSDASFVVISKDTGFDTLIQHLQSNKITCQRLNAIADMFPAKAKKSDTTTTLVSSESVTEKIAKVIDNLQKRKSGKPGKVDKLRTTINALFKKQLTEDELDKIIELLKKRKMISVSDKKVDYL